MVTSALDMVVVEAALTLKIMVKVVSREIIKKTRLVTVINNFTLSC